MGRRQRLPSRMRDREDTGDTLGDLLEGAFLHYSGASCDGVHPSIVFSKIFASLLALSALFLLQMKAFCMSVPYKRAGVSLGLDKELCVCVSCDTCGIKGPVVSWLLQHHLLYPTAGRAGGNGHPGLLVKPLSWKEKSSVCSLDLSNSD